MANYALPINSLYTETGDDVYAKPMDSDFSGSNWTTDSVSAIELEDTNVYDVTVDETKAYIVYLNGHSQSFAANDITDVITAVAHGLLNGQTLRFKGLSLPTGLEQTTIHYVRDKTDDTFKVSLTGGGAAVNIQSTGSGTMTFTSPEKRSKAATQRLGLFHKLKTRD